MIRPTAIVAPSPTPQSTASLEPNASGFHDQTIHLANGKELTLTLPSDYTIYPAYQGLKRIRFMAWSPDGRLFLTDMKDLTDNKEGKVYILENFDPTTKQFSTIHTYLDKLRNPNSVVFFRDKRGTDWIYVALTDKLIRYEYHAGDLKPSGIAQTIAKFPDYGLSYKYGGWHLTRTIAIHNEKVYVSVGSSCNSCEENPDEIRAEVMVMDQDGANQHVYASGLRNAVGMQFLGSDLWVTAMGVDHLGEDKPEEALYKLKAGTNYGWPYCYEFQGRVYADTSKTWKSPIDCAAVPLAEFTFPAHGAPLGLAHIKNYWLVALHGAGDITSDHGNRIVKAQDGGVVEDFITGFWNDEKRIARPADIIKMEDESFLFTDDLGGTLYYVQHN